MDSATASGWCTWTSRPGSALRRRARLGIARPPRATTSCRQGARTASDESQGTASDCHSPLLAGASVRKVLPNLKPQIRLMLARLDKVLEQEPERGREELRGILGE